MGRARRGPHRQRVHRAADFWNRRRRRTAGRARRPAGRARTATIVGIAANTDVGSLFADPRPLAYAPFEQYLSAARHGRHARIRIGADRRGRDARGDPARGSGLAIDRIGTGRTVLAGPFQVMRGFGLTAIGLGAITLLLAMAGLYGIQSNVIANRTREIGVRMSFGATSSQIKRMVLLDGYRPVLDGLLFGLSIGLVGRAIARAFSSSTSPSSIPGSWS